MKKRIRFIVPLVVLVFVIIAGIVIVGSKDSKTDIPEKDDSKTHISDQKEDEDEGTEIDDIILSVEDESVYDEETDAKDSTSIDTKNPTKEEGNSSKDEGMNDTKNETENPYDLDKDGDGFVDGWY